MISTLEMRVKDQAGRQVLLAPFTCGQFMRLFPLPDEIVRYAPTEFIEELGLGNPGDEWDGADDPEVAVWGLYAPSRDNQLVGYVSLSPSEPPLEGGEISTHVYVADAHNQGIGTLAKAALTDLAFEAGMAEVSAVTANPASERSLQKLGFTNTGIDGIKPCGREAVMMPCWHYMLWNDAAQAPTTYRAEAKEGRRRFDAFVASLTIEQYVPLGG